MVSLLKKQIYTVARGIPQLIHPENSMSNKLKYWELLFSNKNYNLILKIFSFLSVDPFRPSFIFILYGLFFYNLWDKDRISSYLYLSYLPLWHKTQGMASLLLSIIIRCFSIYLPEFVHLLTERLYFFKLHLLQFGGSQLEEVLW